MKLNGIDISRIVVSKDEDGLMLWFVASESRVVANLIGSFEEMQKYLGAALMILEDVEKRGLPTVEIPVPCVQCRVNIGAAHSEMWELARRDNVHGAPGISSSGASAPEIENYRLVQEQERERDEVC